MRQLVLVRHGQSDWNRENRFTGWEDVSLSDQGVEEARAAGRLLRDGGFCFDVAFTSYLKRAIATCWLILEEMDRMWIPVHNHWRLNERHYGGLQGLDKAETAARYGDAQVKIWRRSYDVKPPQVEESDPRFPGSDPRYAHLDRCLLPRGEHLKDTVERVMPCWHEHIAPELRLGRRVLIAAHGNSLRALVMDLDRISQQDIVELNIPTGVPLVYELDDELCPVRHSYLGDPEAIERAAKAVAEQGRKK